MGSRKEHDHDLLFMLGVVICCWLPVILLFLLAGEYIERGWEYVERGWEIIKNLAVCLWNFILYGGNRPLPADAFGIPGSGMFMK